MTYGKIVEKILFDIYGETQAPEGVINSLRGTEGIIGSIQRQIQEEYDYWFFEYSTTIALTSGVSAYDLDALIKTEIDFRIKDENNYYFDPLAKLFQGQLETVQPDTGEPRNYLIDWNTATNLQRINLYPIPYFDTTLSQTRTLYAKYYRYLTRLSSNISTFNDTEDRLSIEAPNLIIQRAVLELTSGVLQMYEKAQVADSKAEKELSKLQSKDQQIKFANVSKINYQGL